MPRSKSLLNQMAKAAREIERQRKRAAKEEEKRQKVAERNFQQALKEEEKQRKEAKRNLQQAEKQREKEAKQLYLEICLAAVESNNQELADKISALESVLKDTLDVDDYLDLDTLKESFVHPTLVIPSHLENPAPNKPKLESYLPEKSSAISQLIPGTKKKYEEKVAKGKQSYKADLATYNANEAKRQKQIATLKSQHEEKVKALYRQTLEQQQEIDDFKADLKAGKPEAVMNYCTLVLEASDYPDGFPQHAKIAYVPESKQLVIEYDLPSLDAVIPEFKEYKYIKSRDEISTTAMPATQRKSLYRSVIAQVAIRTIHEVFEADRLEHIDTVVFNGYVDSVDKGTGQDIRTCVVTVRTTHDVFLQLDLSRVEPEACLKTLNASVSQKPEELAPVRPVLELNMVDPRFVEETDVLSTLDQRPNLMELKPTEFESLITNLFTAMGLEARQTQASRDGGVDCVAFDPRPIFGGKVVIQAKRYKNTVGVSAVRDLFGTLQNEGASKGILVTTSGYGKAAFEFAEGKPIELIGGSQLLYLLKEHADIEAKIVVPEAWTDPVADSGQV